MFLPLKKMSWTYCQSVRMIYVLLNSNSGLYGQGHLRGKMTIMRYKCLTKVVHTIEQLSWTCCQSVRMIFVLLGPNFRLYGQGASWHGKWQLWDPCAFKSCSHHWDSCPEHVAKLSGLSMIPLRPQLYTSWTGGILAGKIPLRRDKCLAKVVPTGCQTRSERSIKFAFI